MTASNGWHVTEPTLAAYRAGDADPVLAASVEAHLLACAACRSALAAGADDVAGERQGRRWESLVAVVDQPRQGPLLRLGLASRPLRGAWLVALLLLLVFPLVTDPFLGRYSPWLVMAMAPIAPLAAVVVAYREDVDPTGEIALAAPLAGLRLVARRALLVAAGALPVGVLGALLAGVPTTIAVAWILPGLALASLVLLAGTTRLDPAVAAAALGATWAIGVGAPAALRASAGDALIGVLGGAGFQVTALAVALAAVALTVTRREHVAYRRTA